MGKTKDELLDEHVSLKQCELAVDALLKHVKKFQEEKEKTELLPGREQHVWLVLTVKQMQPEKKLKPFKIPVVHPLVDPRTSSVCLITKDPQREYKDLLEKNNVKFISRVVGVAKLKGKFKGFEERRLLLKENDLFLADDRVIPLLPGLLGKKFFAAKKQPIPVTLTKKDIKAELEKAISSTYFHQNQGTCSSIKIGVASHNSTQILANLKSALPALVKLIKGGWENVQSLHIKTNSSASLPIWTCDLGSTEGARWDGLTADADPSEDESEDEADEGESGEEDDMGGDEAGEEASEDLSPRPEVSIAKKGKKRPAEEELPTPKKKTKPEATTKTSSKQTKSSAVKPEESHPTRTAQPKPTPAKATEASGQASETKSKKGKSSKHVAAPQTTDVKETKPDPPAAQRKQIPATADGVTSSKRASTSTSVVTPSTPAAATTATSTKRLKAPRTLAVEFFEGTPAGTSSSVVPPPNVSADGLAADTPAPGKKKTAKSGAPPISGEPSGSPEVSGITKSGRKGKKKERAVAEASGPVPAAILEKSKDAPSKSAKLTETAGPEHSKEKPTDATELTAKELKQKRGAMSGEKKKEKAVKSKPSPRTAKGALIGKKGLKA